ncbi:putative Xaa-Pro aminopeptidase [Beauveria bassiana]|uniref:Xaa-Pro aminopeptidase n=1 Tax=Beauveria bassiana TaxID=176275 RepID=A0A2N6NY64_BEABA|nr:putative Xaa-Pro aminopeptidase [Beauveria bassiana]
MEAGEFDYDFILEDEFDAISLDKKQSLDEILSGKYPAKNHARKVAQELGVDKGIIYLVGEQERRFPDSDQGPKFRQHRYFYYLSGADYAGCTVTYDIGTDTLVLWIPYTEPKKSHWFGSTPSTAQAARLYDADQVHYISDLAGYITSLPAASTVYALHPDQRPPQLVQHQSFRARSSDGPRIDTTALKPAMNRAREVKDRYEIALVRRANNISSAAHRRVAQSLRRMNNESQLQAVFEAVCTSRDAHNQAYPVIAGAGANGATLHYGANNAPLKGNATIVLDAGCEYRCYASDITRTLPISGSFSPRAAAINDVVARMQNECIALMKPGKLYYEIHQHAGHVAVDGLLKLGILRGTREELIAAGTVSAFFTHGLGHHVGLEVHDVDGDVPLLKSGAAESVVRAFKRGKRTMVTPENLLAMNSLSAAAATAAEKQRTVLRAGMILTIEPGLYFNREYLEGFFRNDPVHSRLIEWDVVERYYPVGGSRTEDCILVTENGYENLTTAPKGQELLDVINGRDGSKPRN